MKRWQPIDDQCDECGNDLEVFTDAEPACMFDGDFVRCPDCGSTGWVSADEGGYCIHLHDEPMNELLTPSR